MKRSAFKPKIPQRLARDPDREKPLPVASPDFRLPVPVDRAQAVPKTEQLRNPDLLAMAKGEACLLRVPDVCNRDRATTVACHSNWGEHGKAGARKADDCWSVWGCSACHRWLDQGPASAEEKRARFDAALEWMVGIWWEIECGMQQGTPRERKAATWALAMCKKSLARRHSVVHNPEHQH